MFYLPLTDIVLKHEFGSIAFRRNDDRTEPRRTFCTTNRMLTVEYGPTNTLEQVQDLIIIKQDYIGDTGTPRVQLTDLIYDVIGEGQFRLYNSIKMNGFEIAMTNEVIGCTIAQYNLSDEDLYDENNQVKPTIVKEGKTITICIPKDPTYKGNYMQLLNKDGWFYVVAFDNDASYGTFITLPTMKANKISLTSLTKPVLRKENLVLEAADYVVALVNTLQELYPEVQLYTDNSKRDDSQYQQFLKYMAFPEGQSDPLVRSIYRPNPIYGSYQTTTMDLQFEYMNNDLPLFLKRRYQAYNNHFITNVTKAYIRLPFKDNYELWHYMSQGPNGSRQGDPREWQDKGYLFSVVWDRTMINPNAQPIQKNPQVDPTDTTALSFIINCRLVVTTIEAKQYYPKVLEKILRHYVVDKGPELNKVYEKSFMQGSEDPGEI